MVQFPTYVWNINGTDMTSYTHADSYIELTRSRDASDYCEIVLVDGYEAALTVAIGQTVLVTRGETTSSDYTEFRGTVKGIQKKQTHTVLSCYPKLHDFRNKLFTTSYDINIDTEAGEVSAIAEDIITDGGATANVTPTGTASGDITLKKFVSKRKSRFDRLHVLAQIVNYLIREDYAANEILFEPEGTTTLSTTLIVGSNVYNNVIWDEEIVSMRNVIYVDGAFEEDTRIEQFSGNASDTEFTLTYEPVSIKVTISGTLQKLGVENGSETYDYTLDRSLKKITFESAPASGTNNIEVEYTTKVPYTAYGKNESSIDTYGIEQEESYTFKDLETVDDAETRLAALLEKLGEAGITALLETDVRGIRPGMSVPVEDPLHPEKNNTYIVQRVKITYGKPLDEVIVGTNDFSLSDFYSNINERLKAIEGERDALNEIIRQLFSYSVETPQRAYYMDFDQRTLDNTFIPGHPVYADVANYPIGVETTTWALQHRIQNENTYREFALDQDFYDSGTSTGVTWDTSTQTISIAAGGSNFLQTEIIEKGPTRTSFRLDIISSLTPILDEATIQISGDNGSTWQTLTALSVSTNFTSNDGTGVLLKITNDNVSTAMVLSNLNGLAEPAIKLLLED